MASNIIDFIILALYLDKIDRRIKSSFPFEQLDRHWFERISEWGTSVNGDSSVSGMHNPVFDQQSLNACYGNIYIDGTDVFMNLIFLCFINLNLVIPIFSF